MSRSLNKGDGFTCLIVKEKNFYKIKKGTFYQDNVKMSGTKFWELLWEY